LDHLIIDVTTVSIVSILAVSGVLIGCIYAKSRSNDPNFIHAKEDRLIEDNEALKKENSYWRHKANQQRGDIKVEGNYDLDDDGSIVSLVKSVLPGVIDLFPEDIQKNAKGLLTNPDLIDLAHEFYKTDPAGVKKLLDSFIKNRRADSSQSPPVPAITESKGQGAA